MLVVEITEDEVTTQIGINFEYVVTVEDLGEKRMIVMLNGRTYMVSNTFAELVYRE